MRLQTSLLPCKDSAAGRSHYLALRNSKQRISRRWLQAERSAPLLCQNPNAGSDVAAMECRATQDGDHWVLNGCKTWISNAGIADFYTVFARTNDSGGAKGISCFIVEAGTPGFDVTERIDLVAPHPLGTLQFKDCRISDAQRVGDEGRGFGIAMATLDVFRSTVAAAALGMARRALDETLNYTASRDIFGGKLDDLQLVQAKIGEMALGVDGSALLVYRAAWTKDCAADRVTREAAMAKYHATETAQQVIDTAVQLHGGKGVTKGYIVESLYRDIRALRIYEGASEVQTTIIASRPSPTTPSRVFPTGGRSNPEYDFGLEWRHLVMAEHHFGHPPPLATTWKATASTWIKAPLWPSPRGSILSRIIWMPMRQISRYSGASAPAAGTSRL